MADAQQNMGQQAMMNRQPAVTNDASETDNQAEEAEEPQEDPAETPPEGQPAAEAAPQPGVKTPEQLLQELQRQQVIQQQQLQQQGAGSTRVPQVDQPNQVPQNPPQD
jgi:hypothetical protein